MISYYQALETVINNTKEISNEKVFFTQALGRVLAEDIYADEDSPPEDNSGMDGFAVRFEDIEGASEDNPAILELIGESKAGGEQFSLFPKTAIAVYTGGLIPSEADTVIQKELTKVEGSKVYIFSSLKKGANVRKKGDDYRKGDLLLQSGTLIRPPELGILSSVNKALVYVKRRPRVGILTTGDEILDVGEERKKRSQIRTSNTYTLYGQVIQAGGEPVILGFAKDSPEDIREKLRWAKDCDLLLTSGGMSVGEYDLVKDFVVEELGVEIVFWKVSQKPGKPVAFGVWGREREKVFFGIPGNPVACIVIFETLVKPAIKKMMGYRDLYNPVIYTTITKEYSRKSGDRLEFVRVKVSYSSGEFLSEPLEKQGSNILTSMVNANGLMIVEEGIKSIQEGEKVKVIIFDREFLDGKGL
ncbi:MAG: molybdopterin molybdotransferase MoeA [Hydrogenothermaceae bacterium]|nr:molybdopterin molybdotransferase MoeA [Hydrogenothermaceae bacterium]